MTMSNLATVLEELESDDPCVHHESPLAADELATLLGVAPPLGTRRRKRRRLACFRDNYSGDFGLFRVR